jgi:hypothetical protein
VARSDFTFTLPSVIPEGRTRVQQEKHSARAVGLKHFRKFHMHAVSSWPTSQKWQGTPRAQGHDGVLIYKFSPSSKTYAPASRRAPENLGPRALWKTRNFRSIFVLRNSRSRKKAVARTIIFPGRISPSLFLNGRVGRGLRSDEHTIVVQENGTYGGRKRSRLPYRPAALLSVRPSRI